MLTKQIKLRLIVTACAVSIGAVAAKAAAPATPQGFINFYTYAGDQRAGIQAGTAIPDGSFYPKRMEGPYAGYPAPDSGDDETLPTDQREAYNMVLKGYFYPPKSGKVQFAMSTDDPGQLYFSTDDDPAHKVQVASETVWNGKRAFGAEARRTRVNDGTLPADRLQNQSQFFDVVAGKAYYIESVGTEFGGGDNNAVAFRFDGDPEFADGDKPILGQYLSPFSVPSAPSILIQPKDAPVYDGSTAVFSVALDAPPTVTINDIKWTKNGADVPDSNSLTLSVKAITADDGAKFKAIINTSAGSLTTSEVTMFVSAFTSDFALGVVKWEAWTGIGGTAVSALLDDAHYQDAPDDIRLLPGIDTPNGYAENYGARVTGFIIPAESGNFDFFIRSDDASQFYLSTSEKAPDPATDPVIAEETGCCDAFHEAGNGDLETTQAPIALVAGKKYAFLAFVKEGTGGDYLQLAMRKVGDATPAGSLRPISGTLVGANAKPTKGDPQITQQPVLPPKMEEGGPWSLSVDGTVTPAGYNYPLLVQWQKDGVDIKGANGKTYAIQEVAKTDGGVYRAVVSAPSGKSQNSTELTAVVIPDTTPPTLKSALVSYKSDTKLNVIFSEPVSAATANNKDNYKINNGSVVNAAAITANTRIVELTTTSIPKGSSHQLTVSGVQDRFGNTIAASSVIDVGFQKGIYLVIADPGTLTFTGDIAVNQHLLDQGFDVAISGGTDVPEDGSSAIGRDLIIETSTLGSGTVEVAGADPIPVGKFKNLAIPAINWEASSIDAFGFAELNAAIGTIASQTQINIVDPTHPLAAGFPKGLVTVTTPETYSQSIPVGGHIVAKPAGDEVYSMIYYYEKGEKGFNDFVMPARRVFFFFQDNTAAAATDNGWKLFDAAVNWALGIETVIPPEPTDKPKFTSIKVSGANIVVEWTGGGTLQAADDITGPWTDITGATSPFTTPITGLRKFARIKQ